MGTSSLPVLTSSPLDRVINRLMVAYIQARGRGDAALAAHYANACKTIERTVYGVNY